MQPLTKIAQYLRQELEQKTIVNGYGIFFEELDRRFCYYHLLELLAMNNEKWNDD
jgi:hypothetical protein